MPRLHAPGVFLWHVWSGDRRFRIWAASELDAGDKARRHGYSVDRIDRVRKAAV